MGRLSSRMLKAEAQDSLVLEYGVSMRRVWSWSLLAGGIVLSASSCSGKDEATLGPSSNLGGRLGSGGMAAGMSGGVLNTGGLGALGLGGQARGLGAAPSSAGAAGESGASGAAGASQAGAAGAAGATSEVITGDGTCSSEAGCFLSCDVAAPQACRHNCNLQSICNESCEKGACTSACQGSATCYLGCSGGGCAVECTGAAHCTASCTGGGCQMACKDSATCTFKCPGGNCVFTCADPGRCTTTCSADAAKPCSGP